MAEEPENLVLKHLRDMREELAGLRAEVRQVDSRVQHVEKQLDNLQKIVTYTLGQATETAFRQTQQDSRLDAMFAQLEKLLSGKEPS